MKLHILGIELAEGISKKSGKPYIMASVHTSAHLAPPSDGNIAKGMMGTTYQADPEAVRRIAHLSFPCTAEVTIAPVMRFGERKEQVMEIKPEGGKGG